MSNGISYQVDQLKFWLHPRHQKWFFHPLDVHHTAMVAKNHIEMDVPRSEILHNPYVDGSPNSFTDWTEEKANRDTVVTATAMCAGWIRGGHIIDYALYLQGHIRHLGGLYVQGIEMRDLRRASRLIVERYPDLHYLAVEQSDRDARQLQLIRLEIDHIDRFIRRGHLP